MLFGALTASLGLLRETTEGYPILAGVFLLGALRVVAGVGTMRGRTWGRTLHLWVSVPSFVNFPVGTAVSILSFVLLTRPAVKLWFAKPDPRSWSPEEADEWRRSGHRTEGIGIAIGIIAVLVFLAVPAASVFYEVVLPSLRAAPDRASQERTIAELREIGAAIDAYAVDRTLYPNSKGQWVPVGMLSSVLEPKYGRGVPKRDGWGNEIMIRCDATSYQIASLGSNGAADVKGMDYGPRDLHPTKYAFEDIVYANGRFVRYPEWWKE